MTYRERRLNKAERLREWAEKRDAKAKARLDAADQTADMIPMGQPILVGHHSEGRHRRDIDRMERNMRAGLDHRATADRMRATAETIESQAAGAIYSDDPVAAAQLLAKIAVLEAERESIKAYNASCRKGQRDASLLTPEQRAVLDSIVRCASFQLGAKGEMPGYALSNLSGNISRLKKRLAQLDGGGCE